MSLKRPDLEPENTAKNEQISSETTHPEVSEGRRKFLIAAVAALGTLLYSHSATTTKVPERRPKEETPEAMTDQLIQRIESAFAEFEKEVGPMIKALEDRKLTANLQGPFRVMTLNRSNPDKNLPKIIKGTTGLDATHAPDTSNSYAFNYIAQEPGTETGYAPLSKTVSISSNFDPRSLYDLLAVFHALKHVVLDSNVRIELHSPAEFQQYTNFYEDEKNFILNYEAEATAYEIELLNLLVEGELATAAKEQRPVNFAKLSQKIKPRDLERLADIIELSQIYYPDGANEMTSPKSPYLNHIGDTYRRLGKKVWFILENGELIEY